MNNPFGRIEIYVSDMNRAKAFYEAVFQVSLENMAMPEGMDDGMQMLAFPSDMQWQWSGALVKMEGVNPGIWWTLAYFSCEDCAVELARVAAAWGKVAQEKMSIGNYGFMGTAIDTEGNMIGFHSMK